MRHRWTVAILNQPREIERIEQRFYVELANCDDVFIHYYGNVPISGGLHCKIFSFSSERGKLENPHKVYDNPRKFKKDRALWERDEDKWEAYINTFCR